MAALKLEREKQAARAGAGLTEDGDDDKEKHMRGPSLMDLHMEGKKVKESSGQPKDRAIRRPFDREQVICNCRDDQSTGSLLTFGMPQDVLSHRKMTSREAAELVEKSKELSSRFSRGMVQKTFM